MTKSLGNRTFPRWCAAAGVGLFALAAGFASVRDNGGQAEKKTREAAERDALARTSSFCSVDESCKFYETRFPELPLSAELALASPPVSATGTAKALGQECGVAAENPLQAVSASCQDVDPGAFHIVLANELSRRRTGIIIDSAQDEDTAEETVASYESVVLRRRKLVQDSSADPFEEVMVETRVHTLNADEEKNVQIYRYRLELNRLGRIQGGVWLSAVRPDTVLVPAPRLLATSEGAGAVSARP